MLLRSFLCGLLNSACVWAALTVSPASESNVSAVYKLSGVTAAACTIELSAAADFSTVHPDVDPAKYASSNTCTGRTTTVTDSNGDVYVWLGTRVSDRALFADTNYYVRFHSASDTATSSFHTATIGVGNTRPEGLPVDRTRHNNRGFGLDHKAIAANVSMPDPQTGAKLAAIRGLSLTAFSYNFAYWSDGSGWTTPANIMNTASSGAATNNTNPITLYVGPDSAPHSQLYRANSWDDLGILVYACGSAGASADRNFKIFLSPNFSKATVGQVQVTGVTQCSSPPTPLPLVNSASTYNPWNAKFTGAPWPNEFPCFPFCGWGAGAYLGMDDRPTSVSSASSSAQKITSTNLSFLSHFSVSMESGNKVAFPGCSQGSGLCSVTSLIDSGGVNISDTIANASGTAVALRAGIQIKKDTPTGTLWISVKYAPAESMLMNANTTEAGAIGSLTTRCNSDAPPVTSADGHPGMMCYWQTNSANFIYFLATDGSGISRFVYHGGGPYPPSLWTDPVASGGVGLNPNDVPFPQNVLLTAPWFPDPADGRSWYVQLPAGPGNTHKGIYKYTYTGTFPPFDAGYTYDLWGGSPNYAIQSQPLDFWTITMVGGYGHRLEDQLASFPGYPLAALGDAFTLSGVSGTNLYFHYLFCAQDCAAWIAIVDIATLPMTLRTVFNTYDRTGMSGLGGYGALHGIAPRPGLSKMLGYSVNTLPMYSDTSTVLANGPYMLPVIAIDRGTTGSPSWSANTALGASYTADPTYLAACPANSWGATGNSCLHIKIPPGGACSTSPNNITFEKPCPATGPAIPAYQNRSGMPAGAWTPASYSQPRTLEQGDTFVDPRVDGNGVPSGQPGIIKADGENFVVITNRVTEADGSHSVWVHRDAGTNYCCYPPNHATDGVNCLTSAGQTTHLTGWTGWMMMSKNAVGCSSANFILQGTTEADMVITNIPRDLGGHTDLVKSYIPGHIGYVASGNSAEAATLTALFDWATVKTLAVPIWHGQGTPIGGGVQAYTITQGASKLYSDAQAINGNTAGLFESIGGAGSGVTVTATSCANVYKITPMQPATVEYKYTALRGFAGARPLQEVSSPTVDLCSAGVSDGTFAYALKNGEAMSGTPASLAGDIYFKLAGAQANNFGTGGCVLSQHWALTPCIIASGWTGGGYVRQRDWSTNDTTGVRNRFITTGLELPLGQYGYYASIPLTDRAAWNAWAWLGDHGSTMMTLTMPSWVDDSATVNRTDLISVTVPATATAGSTHARVKFGRNKSFYCVGTDAIEADGSVGFSGRREACVTDEVAAQPFKFASEAQTYKACAPTCNISVPLAPQVPYMAQIEYLNSTGTVLATSPLMVIQSGTVSMPCYDLTFTPSSASAAIGGATGTFNATVTDSSCDRSVTSSTGWLTCSANCTGTGSVSGIGWAAAANAGTARSASLTGGGVSFVVTQSGTTPPTCMYSLAPTSHNYPAAGATQAVTVTASDVSCAWTATYPDAWLSGSASGTGTQTFNVSAAVNAGTLRSSTATIAGQSYAATQDGSGGGTGTPSTMISGGHALTGGIRIQ